MRLLTAFVLATVSTFIANQVFRHDFGDQISPEDQRLFSEMYVRTLSKRESMMFVFDCRNVQQVDPVTIWQHISVFRGLREVNRRKVAGFSILIRSEMLRAVLTMIFRLVPPSAPFVVTDNYKTAFAHVCRCWSTSIKTLEHA
jgi:hypothetical protein